MPSVGVIVRSFLKAFYLLTLGSIAFGQTTLSTTALNFGNVAIGEVSANRTVTLKNVGASAVTVNAVGLSGSSQYTLAATGNQCSSGEVLASTASCNVAVALTPAAPGAVPSSSLSITTTASNPSETATLSGNGVQPTTLSYSPINFGNAVVNETSATRTVTLYNNQLTALTISSITASSSFSVASTTCGSTLAAFAGCTITLNVTPTALGPVPTGSLTIVSSAPNSPLVSGLTGTGIQPASLSSSSVGFGSVAVNEASALKTVTLYNNQLVPLTLTSIVAPAPYLVSGTTCGATLSPSSNCSISLTLTPPAIGTVVPSSLTVSTNAANSPLIAALTGTGVQPTSFSPAALGFGNAVIHEATTARTLTLHNLQLTPLSILSVTVPSGYSVFANTCGASLAASSSCTISVVLTPAALGAVSPGVVTVTTNAANSPLTAPLTGNGVPATTLSAPSLNLGSAVVGSTSPTKLLTIHNQSSGSLTLSGTIFNGPFALDNTSVIANECPLTGGSLGGTIPALSSCVVGITFTPAALGNTTGGKVTILDTDPSGPVSATLAGNGVNPSTLTPAVVNFGNVVENTTSATKTVVFNNYQSVPFSLDFITVAPPYSLTTGVNACAVGTPVAPTSRCSVYLTYSPVSVGPNPAATLTVQGTEAGSVQVFNSALTGGGILPVRTNTATVAFGNVVLGESKTSTFAFTNNQSVPTAITSLVGPTGDYAINPSGTTCALSPAIVNPAPTGNSCIVSITFTPSALGPQPSSITVNNTSPLPAVSVNIVGAGVPPVSLSSTSLNFPAQTEGLTGPALTSKLTNLQNIPLNIVSATLSGANPADFGVTTTCPTVPVSLPAFQTCLFSLTFTPTASGRRTATLSIVDDATSAPLTISLAGGGNAPVAVSPTSITNFSAPVGTTSRVATITIKNTQAATPLHINNLQLSGDFLQSASSCPLAPAVLAPLTSCTVSIQFDPQIGGTRNGQLQVDDDAITSPQVVNLSGVGTSPLTIAPGSLAYSAQLLNTTSPAKAITLTNHETQPETFSLATTGDYNASSNCSSGTIPAKASCLIYVHFAPSSVSPSTRVGALSITHSAAIGSPLNASLTGSAISTPPGAAVAVVSPGAGAAGTAVNVVITGNGWTHFSPASVITFVDQNSSAYPSDITVTGQTFVSANQLHATLQLSGGAGVVYGARNITVKTPRDGGGTESASLLSAFIIGDPTNAHDISVVSPSIGRQGQTMNVAVTGVGTNWLPGVTYANFGDGVAINSLTVTDPEHATANVTISNTTPVGYRTITLVTGGEFDVSILSPQNVPLFQIVPNDATLVTVTPNIEPQGFTGPVTLRATGTHFLQNATTVSIGGAIVGDVNVVDSLTAVAEVVVPAGASLGPQNVTVSTGGEITGLSNAFTITGATPALLSVSPSAGKQGQSFNVVINGNAYTNFVVGQVSVEFNGNIQTGPIVVNSLHQVTVPVTIAFDANAMSFTANLLSGLPGATTIFPFTFTVTASSASIVSVTPSSVPQGGQVTLAVVGQNTKWVQGTTVAGFYPQNVPLPSFDIVTIGDSVDASLNIAVPTNTPPGSYPFYMATGGQVVSSAVTVYANTPTLTMSPANGLLPTGTTPNSFTVNFSGHFTNFSQTDTLPVVAGEGVTLSNFVVSSLNSASGTLSIAPGSPLGLRKVTFTTGGEIVVTYFNVTETPVGILNVIPYYAPQNATLNVEIVGLNTHFTQGSTQVLFGPEITVNSITVNNPTDLIANITTSYLNGSVLSAPAPGWQTVYVNTPVATASGLEQVLAAFDVSAPASPALVSVVPSSAQQGSTVNVTITGSLTSWNGSTEAILGSGVTVSNLTVLSPTSATATLAVSPTAPVGPNSVTMITGTELESGVLFSVTPGAASIVSVEPNFNCPQRQQFVTANFGCANGGAPTGVPVVAQLQTVTLNIVGVGTHWLQGETTLNFGSGVTVDRLTVSTPTTAQVQITVLSSAPVGFATLTAYTDGENAFLAQAIDIEEGSATLLAFSPGSAEQDGTITLQVLGRFTHFSQTATNVAFNQDITVNSINVVDSETLTANVTVSPLAYVDYFLPCGHVLTITTGNEQISSSPVTNNFCVAQGAEEITSVSPLSAIQGSTLTVSITGAATNFVAGETQVSFGDPNFQVGQITVTSPTTLTASVGVSTAASAGFKNISVSTLGQVASQLYSFTVSPGVATLNEAIPNQAEQGAPLPGDSPLVVRLLGQYSNFSAQSTATFGPGITVLSVAYVSPTEVDATISIDPLSYVGQRTVTVATPNVPCSVQPQVLVASVNYAGCTPGISVGTGTEIVSASVFNIIAGPAIITGITPSTGNEGQEVVATINGSGTHWAQNFTQFYIAGAGSDITVNSVVINSPTSASVDMTIAQTANAGARSISMVTNGEALTDRRAFVVTGGIPVITTVSPNTGAQGATGLEVTVTGNAYTQWNSSSTVTFGPGVTVSSFQVDDTSHIEAVLNIDPAAQLGYHTVVVQTGTQVLTSNFLVITAAAAASTPQPYIWEELPSSGIPGQTLSITFVGAYTHWDPNPTLGTQLTGFAPGIALNSFQVTSPTTAVANITISPQAAASVSDLTLTTNTAVPQEVDAANFSVVIAQPILSVVDPGAAIQGANNLTVNIIGQFTAFDPTTTFSFGPGITANGPPVILGPTIATQSISVGVETATGYHAVIATTPDAPSLSQSVGGAGVDVTPSLALISAVSPNTATQGSNITVEVTGQFTHWSPVTNFQFGAGIVVSTTQVNSPTDATLTLVVPPLASEGPTYVTATTAGETATLNNGFVVQAGTPLLLSSGPGSLPQQSSATFTILSQATNWSSTNPPVVSYGPGVVLTNEIVTGPTSLTVDGFIQPTTPTGYRNLTVTTGSQILNLQNVFYVVAGPAVVNSVTPNTGGQGANLSVNIRGINTNWQQGITQLNFPGVLVNSFLVNSPTSITANITISDYASAGQVSVTATTAGETAYGSNVFTITQTQPEELAVVSGTGMQGQSELVTITGAFTHFSPASVPSFGAGIAIDSINAVSNTSLQVNITVSPTATTGLRNVSVATGPEAVTLNNSFNVTLGPAAVASLAPSTGGQGGTYNIAVTGSQTHFAPGVTTASFSGGANVTSVTVTDLLDATVGITIPNNTPLGQYNVILTTGGEVAAILPGFTVTSGSPVISAVTPPTGSQGTTNLSVQLTGLYTHFATGTSVASFGAGITVNSLTVNSATSATASITIAAGATLGSRTVTVTTGGEVANITGGFSVTAGVPALLSALPGSAQAGTSANVVVTGQFTTFQQGFTSVGFGNGVTVNSVTVNSLTQLTASISVAPNATVAARDITVTTSSQNLTLTAGFSVLAGTPVVTYINPNIGNPGGSAVVVSLTGQYTNWGASTKVSFGPGISVGGAASGAAGPVNVTDSTDLTATLTLDAAAALGPRTVTITTGSEMESVPAGFTVQPVTIPPPTVNSVSPIQSAVNVPSNSDIFVVFSQPMLRSSINTTNVTLSTYGTNSNTGYAPVSGTVALDATGLVLTFTPTAPLAVNTYFSFSMYGVKDATGNALGGFNSSFTTGFNANNTAPVALVTNPLNNIQNVGTNVQVRVEFSTQMDEATGNGITVTGAGATVAGSLTWTGYYSCSYYASCGIPGATATFTPSAPLAPNTTYTVNYGAPLTDVAGNAVTPGSFTFTTGSGPDTAYSSTSANVFNGQQNLPTNFAPVVYFSKPVNAIAVTSNTLRLYNTDSGKYLQGAVAVSLDGLSATFTPSTLLLPDTEYAISMSGGTYDMDANYLYGNYASFVTGPSTQTTPPQVSSIYPANANTSVPLNAQVIAHLSEPVVSSTVTSSAITLTPAGGSAILGTVALASDQVTLSFVPASTLLSSTVYTVQVSGYSDFAGNLATPFTSTFTTLTSVTPVNVSTGFTAGGTLSTVNNTPDANWTVTPTGSSTPQPAQVVGPGDTGFYSGWPANGPKSSWIALNPNSNTGNTYGTYSTTFNLSGPSLANLCLVGAMGVDDNGLLQINGNPIQTQISAISNLAPINLPIPAVYLKTGANTLSLLWGSTDNYYEAFRLQASIQTCGASLTGGLNLVSATPAGGTTSVPTNSTITLTFNNPLDPATVTDTTLPVMIGWNSNNIIGGKWSVAGTQAVFAPDAPFPANTQIYVGNCNGPFDLAGDTPAAGCYGLQLLQFTTAALGTPAATPFQVTAFTPASGATQVGLRAPVTATFNRSFNPSSLNQNSPASGFTLYNGDNLDCSSYNRSSDNTTLSFNCYPLPSSSTLTALVNGNLTDQSGNPAAEFRSQFSTSAYDSSTAGALIDSRPGTGNAGVAATVPLTLIFNLPVNASTVNAGIQVAQNNVPLAGTIQVADNGYTVIFTPSTPFTAGALIQWWTTSSLLDATNGNAFSTVDGYFNVAASTAALVPTITAFSPATYTYGTPLNSVFDFQFNVPLNASTVNATNIYLYDTSAGLNVPATYSMPQPNEVLIVPSAPLSANDVIYLYVTTGLQSSTSVPATANTYGFYTYGPSVIDSTLPSVVSAVPFNNATNVGINITPAFVLSKAIDPVSVNSSTFQVSNAGTPLSGTYYIDNSNTRINFVPDKALPPSTTLKMTLSGVKDVVGNPIVYSSSFQTGAGPDVQSPTVLYTSIPNGGVVPANASLTIQFSESMDITTFNTGNIYLYDNVLGSTVQAALSWSADQSIAYLVPSSSLAAGRSYYLYVYNGYDIAGNRLQGTSYNFTVALASSGTAPTVTAVSPINGSIGLGINTLVQAQFTASVDPNTLGSVTLSTAGTPIAANGSLSAANTLLQVVPATPLSASTTYTLTIAGVKDPAGNAVTTVTDTFTTGATYDLIQPSVVSANPPANATVGTNVVPKIVFNKPLNPITVTNNTFRMYLRDSNQFVPLVATPSSDGLSVTLHPQLPLEPSTNYRVQVCCGLQDFLGNALSNEFDIYFTTAAGADTTPPTVTFNPLPGSTSIPLNAQVIVAANKALDPTSWTQMSIQLADNLSHLVAGTVSQIDNQTLAFAPASPLSAGITYTASVSGFTDVDGNSVAATSSQFSTGTAISTGGLTLLSTNIPPSSTNVSATQPIILTFTQILDPLTVNSTTLKVMHNWDSNAGLAGTYTVNGAQVTFTPASPYPAGAYITVGECGGPTDVLGEVFLNGSCYGQQLVTFTVTAATPDTTPLTVTSVNPAAGATGVRLDVPVSVTFNKSINPSTVYYTTANGYNNALLLAGTSTQDRGSVTFSADNRTITFNAGMLQPGTGYTISLPAGGISDQSGNTLASIFTSTFTTGNISQATSASVIGPNPGYNATGVPAGSLLTLYLATPVDSATLTGNLVVTVNGKVYPGSMQSAASGYEVQYTPASPFPAGAVVQWFFSKVYDVNNNLYNTVQGTFYIATAIDPNAAPQVLQSSPPSASRNMPVNGEIDILYSLPLDPASIAGVAASIVDYGGGSSFTASLPSPNLLRLIPTSPFAASSSHDVCLGTPPTGTNSVKASNPYCYNFTTTATGADTTPGTVQGAPPDGSINVGTNAYIRGIFSKPLDRTTVNNTSIQVTAGGVAIPGTFSFVTNAQNDPTGVDFSPVNPLPPSTVIKVTLANGVLDYAGNSFTSGSMQFTTAALPVYTGPTVSSSIAYGQTNVPTNASFTCSYSAPIDPTSINPSSTYVYSYVTQAAVPVTYSVSTDLTAVTMTPLTPLFTETNYILRCYGAIDLTGNGQSNNIYNYFTTGAGPNAVGPHLRQVNPPNGSTNVPLNSNNGAFASTSLGLLFNEPIASTSLGGITLTPAGGSPLAITLTPEIGDTELAVQLPSALLPNTTYTFNVASVTDLSGNAITPVATTFTTGSTYDSSSPAISATLPADGATAVDPGSALSVTFSEAMNPVLVVASSDVYVQNHNTSAYIPANLTISSDDKTVTVTPAAPLSPATIYDLVVYPRSGWYLTNIAGTPYYSPYVVATFTTSTPAAVNGVCGSANGLTLAQPPPTANLCSAGTPSPVLNPGLTAPNFDWSCNGLYSGTTVSCSAVSSPATACYAKPSGLVGWWTGNDTPNDSIGGNNGTLENGVTYTLGKVGDAFNLDGTNQYVLIGQPVPANLQIQNTFTLSAWIYVTGLPVDNGSGPYGFIVGSQHDGTTSGATLFYDGNSDDQSTNGIPAGHILLQIGDGTFHPTSALTQVPMNRWVLVTAVGDANNPAAIYYNGVLQPSVLEGNATQWTGTVTYTDSWFAIGQQSDYNRGFNGLIDDVQVYNTALTATQVQAIYAAGRAGLCP